MTTPSLIVFDLGGVLIRICRGWSEACIAAGLEVRGESSSHTASGGRHEWAEKHGIGSISSEEFYRRASESMSGLYSPDDVRRVHDAWLISEYEGVAELIDSIRAGGLSTGVLSNTNHAHWVRLTSRRMGGTGEFACAGMVDHPHASHLLGLMKPSVEIYRAFERMTGYSDRVGEILIFDDLAENVEAARACGWRAEQIDHTTETAQQVRGHLLRHGLKV